ncbi:sulfatase [Paenibacillus contaminans]|uniref:Sulfatase n=1 Tax=Paenibacillus contaminans TaxID=450362 RepID=A0A329ML69_9BACL|nr:sulfatase [Paenibacillus contaminans]RAV20380.1 sulfatase [Paenibacillus contaminans]
MTQAGNRPNILYVFADQWRRQAVGFRKEDTVLTPNMDRFAAESLAFDNALSCTPLCSPHRAALLTGRYPLTTGVYTNCKLGTDVMLREDEIGIGDVLKQAGYDTGYIGKWHLDLPEQNVTPEPESGAREWDAYTPPGPKRHGFDFWYSYGAYDHHLEPHYWRDSPDRIDVKQWSPEHETDVAVSFVESRAERGTQDKPFALFLSWNPPHSPFELVPDKYRKLYEGGTLPLRPNVRPETLKAHTGEKVEGGVDNLQQYMRDYYAAVTGIDEQFGRLLDTLRKQGLEENTIVVLTADHGELMGAHGLMAKHSWHEESIGIPFLIRWPGRIAAGTCDALLNSVDHMPTLLALAGCEIPQAAEGTDLSPAMLGGRALVVATAFLSAFPGRLPAIREFEAAGLDNKRYGWRGVRTKRYTYVVHLGYAPNDPVERLLYDLKEDPYQLAPVHINDPKSHVVADWLDGELRCWLARTSDPFAIDG